MTIFSAVLASSANSTSSINDVTPGLLGFLVVAALGFALVFLLRSMNKQFRKIGPRPEELEEMDVDAAGEAQPDDGGVVGEATKPASSHREAKGSPAPGGGRGNKR